MMGDFIHSLSAVKNICQKENAMANIYITDNQAYGGDIWKYGADKAHSDVKDLVLNQSYVNKFEILSNQKIDKYCNLNAWRGYIMGLYRQEGAFNRCWSDFISQTYSFSIPAEFKWMQIVKDDQFSDKIVIHRSTHRHNKDFPWQQILNSISSDILFITSSEDEFSHFQFKNEKVKIHLVKTISEMAIVIGSSRYFIGNQSAPAAIASALDIPRTIELGQAEYKFYSGESKYSKNISWFLNNGNKHIAENSIIKI